MRRIKLLATNLGLGIGAVYAFFLIPQIESLFDVSFMILLRQVLAIGFGICLLINPKSLVDAGEHFAPKLINVLNVLFGKSNKNE